MRRNGTRAAVQAQAEALGLAWRVSDGPHDWQDAAVMLDAYAADEPYRPQGDLMIWKEILVDEGEPVGEIFDVSEGVFEFGRYSGHALEDYDRFHWNELKNSDSKRLDAYPERHVFVHPQLQYGDYSGGTVPRSNVRVFLEEWGEQPGVYEVYGSHGSHGVAVAVDVVDPDIVGALKSLSDYPLLNEEDHSRLETELQAEAFDNFGRADFTRALEQQLGVDIDGQEEPMGELFWQALRDVENDGVAYTEHTVEGVVFPISDMVDYVDHDDLDAAGVEYEEDE